MQDILIYGGIGINILGALILMAYAMKYAYAFRKANEQPAVHDAMKREWSKKRTLGFGLMIIGSAIIVLGCML